MDLMVETPVIGYFKEGHLYLPTFASTHSAVPSRIYAYYEKREMVGVLRETEPLVGPEERKNTEAPDPGYTGRFVYRIEGGDVPSGYKKVLIFRERKYLKYEDGAFFDTKSNLSWSIVSLASSEGGHDYLQTMREGKCIAYIDYYYYVPYDTESAGPDAHNAARCGREIRLDEVHP
jgi:hypothetical protein